MSWDGWQRGPGTAPLSTENQEKRLEWCKAQQASGDLKFENVLWTDECTIQLESHWRITFHKKGEPIQHRMQDASSNASLEVPFHVKSCVPYPATCTTGMDTHKHVNALLLTIIMLADSFRMCAHLLCFKSCDLDFGSLLAVYLSKFAQRLLYRCFSDIEYCQYNCSNDCVAGCESICGC